MKPRFISLFTGIGLHDLGLARAGGGPRLGCRRGLLKALGNANPPGVPELIGRWFLNILEARRV